MLKYTRGKIEILDIEGLREGACECYETVKEHTVNCCPHTGLLCPRAR